MFCYVSVFASSLTRRIVKTKIAVLYNSNVANS